MKIQEIITQGVSGKVIEFSVAELIVLRGTMANINDMIILPFKEKSEGDESQRVSAEYAAKRVLGRQEMALPIVKMLENVALFFDNITDNVTSLEEASKSLFAVKEEVKEEVAEYNEL